MDRDELTKGEVRLENLKTVLDSSQYINALMVASHIQDAVYKNVFSDVTGGILASKMIAYAQSINLELLHKALEYKGLAVSVYWEGETLHWKFTHINKEA